MVRIPELPKSNKVPPYGEFGKRVPPFKYILPAPVQPTGLVLTLYPGYTPLAQDSITLTLKTGYTPPSVWGR
jgi:hypothetical protein